MIASMFLISSMFTKPNECYCWVKVVAVLCCMCNPVVWFFFYNLYLAADCNKDVIVL